MRIVQVNPGWDAAVSDPSQALENWPTTTGWMATLKAAGAEVSTVGRFGNDAKLEVEGAAYRFLADGGPARPQPRWRSPKLAAAVADAQPDAVFFHSLLHPGLLRDLRRALPGGCVIAVQHHAELPPIGWRQRWQFRLARRSVDLALFAASELADPWRGLTAENIGLLMEASTTFVPIPIATARDRLAIRGQPVVAWVGRFDDVKDPLTVLEGVARAASHLPQLTLELAFSGGRLESEARERIVADPRLASRVRLRGRLDRSDVQRLLSAADLFVSGSRSEGSGFACIEALACGALPVVTDIPSHRQLAGGGRFGRLWPVGSADELARQLLAASVERPERAAIIDYFETNWAWPVLGGRLVELLRVAAERRR